MIGFDDARSEIAAALYRLLMRSSDQEWFSPAIIAKEAKLDMGVAFIRRVAVLCEQQDEEFYTNANGNITLGREGFEVAKKWSPFPPQANESDAVPASDRIVSRSDNDPQVAELGAILDEISNSLRTNNESGAVFGEDRDIALQEISTLKQMIEATRIRVSITVEFGRRALNWIIEKAGAAAVAEIAKRALAHLISWLT